MASAVVSPCATRESDLPVSLSEVTLKSTTATAAMGTITMIVKKMKSRPRNDIGPPMYRQAWRLAFALHTAHVLDQVGVLQEQPLGVRRAYPAGKHVRPVAVLHHHDHARGRGRSPTTSKSPLSIPGDQDPLVHVELALDVIAHQLRARLATDGRPAAAPGGIRRRVRTA